MKRKFVILITVLSIWTSQGHMWTNGENASFYLSPFLYNWSSKLGISNQVFVFLRKKSAKIEQKGHLSLQRITIPHSMYDFWEKLARNFLKQYFRNSHRMYRLDFVSLTRSTHKYSTGGWINPPAMIRVNKWTSKHNIYFDHIQR